MHGPLRQVPVHKNTVHRRIARAIYIPLEAKDRDLSSSGKAIRQMGLQALAYWALITRLCVCIEPHKETTSMAGGNHQSYNPVFPAPSLNNVKRKASFYKGPGSSQPHSSHLRNVCFICVGLPLPDARARSGAQEITQVFNEDFYHNFISCWLHHGFSSRGKPFRHFVFACFFIVFSLFPFIPITFALFIF